MNEERDFVDHALGQIADAVVYLIGLANLQVRATPLPRALARRVGGRLAGLERMVARVMMLMALAILPGLAKKARGGNRPALVTPVRRDLSTNLAPTMHEQPARRRLRLSPRPIMTLGTASFPGLPGARGPVPLARIAARIRALQTVLNAPDARARRLAFHLARLQAKGEAAPVVVPIPRPKGASRGLALAAGILPVKLSRALAEWDDSG